EPIVVLNSVLNAPSMVISIIGNILLLVAVLRTPSIRSPSTILLCSLALSDLLVGVVVQSLYLAAFLKRNHSVLNASRTLSFIASGASLFTMTAIAFEANYSSNSSANPNIGFETVVTVNCILNAPLMLLSIIGNALLLVAILRTPSIQQTPSLRLPSVIFLCNLAVSDLLVGLVVQPVYIVEQMVRIVPKLQEAVGAMRFAGCGVSLSTMTAITVDRFFALHYHLQHPYLMTTSRAIYTIITIRCIITLFSFSILWSPRIYYFLVAFLSQSAFCFAWFLRNDPLLWLSSSKERHRTQQIPLLLLLLVLLRRFLLFVLLYKLAVPPIPQTVVIANCILNVPLMLLSIIGNALVLVAILRTPSIRSPSVIFLCNLAVSDLLVGLVVQPVYVAAEIARTVRALSQAAETVGFAGCGVSLATMTAITVDRFLALHYHLQYPNLITTSRAICTIIT
ncbi:unnamed protein product, partial [Pocillopora meandrina]